MKKVADIQFTKEPYIEDVGPRKIKSMKFCTLSGSEIQKAAEVQVWRGQYYDSSRKPIENGLLDPHMGPANKGCICDTCQGGFQECPGHFGYLNLALPTFHEGYLGTIVNILKCICKSCSRILMEEKKREENLKKMRNPKLDNQKKENLLKEIIKKNNTATTCTRCGYENGTVRKNLGKFGILYKGTDGFHKERAAAISHTKESKTSLKTDSLINPAKIYSLFSRMLDEDCELLCLSDRPEKLLITTIPVPPIAIRPSVIVDGSQSNENDITERLKRIIQANAMLHKELQEASATNNCLDNWEQLQCDVAYYINSDVKGFPIKYLSDRQLAGFSQRLKGKNGRFRGNLSGKRVEFTGRTVISPDPNLKITEVAIPIHMARILTYPERVSHHNIEKLRQCVRNGPNKYPGARMVRQPDGEMRHLMFSARKHIADELKYGYVVDRHLEDGDVVLFNRQPSLHRMSIMSHRARIMPWRTLRFNESVCNPYNADFDGDEMNMHVPQTEEARTEALMLMGVQNNLCTPKNGEILVASTQDFLTSSFLITRKDTFYDRAAFALMCSYMGDGMDIIDLPTPTIIKPIELWTGKQLFSVLVRPHAAMRVYLNLTVKEKNYTGIDPKKGITVELESMCPNDGFVYFRNSELISGQLGKATLGNGNKNGLYSVLLRDYNAHAAATCMNRLAKLSARWIGNHGFSIGIDDVTPGKLLNCRKEETIQMFFDRCDKDIKQFNEGKLTVAPGCDAAQTLEAQVSEKLNKIREKTAEVCMAELHWRNSPLIMSQCGSKGSPINISQMIACVGQQSVGGRRAPDGFIDRSLPHFPRNTKTPDAKGFVASSFYSGLSATEFFFHTMGGREGLVDTAVKTADTGYMSRRLMKVLEDLFVHYDTTVRNASGGIVQFRYGDDGMDPAYMEGKDGVPLDFARLLLKVEATCPADGKENLSPKEASEIVERRLAENDKSPEGPCSEMFKNSLRQALGLPERVDGQEYMKALEKVAKIQKITKRQLEVFLGICISRYNVKKIEAGTAIGAIGAQSIGEPGTQMTLKTFHFAGVASMNVTLGVPRIKEIINAAKKISTPIITAKLEVDDDMSIAKRIQGCIEKTSLGQVAKSIELVITPRSSSLCINLDMKSIQELNLCIDANIVKESILKTTKFPFIQRKGSERAQKIKLDEKDIKVLNERELEIFPQNYNNRDELLFTLQSLKNMIPSVIVTGIKTAERAVINVAKENVEAEKEKVEAEKEKAEAGEEKAEGGEEKAEGGEEKAEGGEEKVEGGKEKVEGAKVKERYTILVEGTGLLSVMGTDGVDGTNTCSNHVMEVFQTIGIEAARRCIIDEIDKTMKGYGMSIDIRHMMLLADVMTVRGEVLGITRFGIAKMDKSVLMQASFERQSDHLFGASVNGREDRIEGVSECIIMGVPVPIGTGILKVRQRDDVVPIRYDEEATSSYKADSFEINPVLS